MGLSRSWAAGRTSSTPRHAIPTGMTKRTTRLIKKTPSSGLLKKSNKERGQSRKWDCPLGPLAALSEQGAEDLVEQTRQTGRVIEEAGHRAQQVAEQGCRRQPVP